MTVCVFAWQVSQLVSYVMLEILLSFCQLNI